MALRRLSAGFSATLAVAIALATVPAGANVRTGNAAGPTKPIYAASGPYAAGVTTLALPDRAVEVWYPAKRRSVRSAVPASFELVERVPPAIAALLPAGKQVAYETDAYRDVPAARKSRGFPLVLMAHGVAGFREQLVYLGSHLASWGFVVASPDLLERGLSAQLGSPPPNPVDDLTVMRDTEALVRAADAATAGLLAGRVLADRVAVTGQSAGGGTAIRFSGEPGVVAAVPISASGFDARTGDFSTVADVPVMFVTGGADQLVPVANVEAGFARASAPARFVAVDGAGHANVAGICPIGGPGGLVGLAEEAQLPLPDSIERLASDGCANPAPDPDPSWAPIRHAITAQLREAFGIDRRPKGLDPETMAKFAPVVVQYQEKL